MPAVIALPADGGSELRLFGCRLPLNELGMRFEGGPAPLDDCGQVAFADEHENRELRVAPGLVAKELVNGLGELRRAVPELALGDEEVAAFVLDADIGMASEVERFSCSCAAVVGVERVENDVPTSFFSHAGVRTRRDCAPSSACALG